MVGFQVARISDWSYQEADEYNRCQACDYVGRDGKLLIYRCVKISESSAWTYLAELWGIGRQEWISRGIRRQFKFYDSDGVERAVLFQLNKVQSIQALSAWIQVQFEAIHQHHPWSSPCKTVLKRSPRFALLPSEAMSVQALLILSHLHSWWLSEVEWVQLYLISPSQATLITGRLRQTLTSSNMPSGVECFLACQCSLCRCLLSWKSSKEAQADPLMLQYEEH